MQPIMEKNRAFERADANHQGKQDRELMVFHHLRQS
jgi:hypothetical protein